ncbi:MAG: ABC transporter permease [Bacilli bacterium]|nr:ABC transporter permease [Bacilli bacterium]
MITILISTALRTMAVYIFGASGDTIIEKGGHLNMGVPGIMFFGALGSLLGEVLYVNSVPASMALNGFLVIFIPLIGAVIFGGIGGLIYCFLTVTLKCNQNVVGLTLTTFGVALSRFFIVQVAGMGATRMLEASDMIRNLFPGYKDAGAFGEMFLSGSFFTYFSIIVAVVASIILAKTAVGLNLRAVGENPASADAAGINVTKYKYLSTIIGSAVVGLGGLTYYLDVAGGHLDASYPVDSFGWLCLSIVILCAWRSWITIPVSFAIGFLTALPNSPIISVPSAYGELIRVIPYVASIIILIISSAVGSKKMQPPAGLGKTYFREDR